MKKFSKIMFTALSVALVVCMAVGLVACDKNPDNGDNSQTDNYTVTEAQWNEAMSVKNYTVTVENSSIVKYVENDNGSLISYQELGSDGATYYFEVKGDDVYKYQKLDSGKWKREKDDDRFWYNEALTALGVKLSALKGKFDKFEYASIGKCYEDPLEGVEIGDKKITLAKFFFVNGKFDTTKDNHYDVGLSTHKLSAFGTTAVTLPQVDIEVSLNRITIDDLKVGATITLTATVDGSDEVVVWASDNEAVATVDNTGKVTGVKAGTAKISASVGNVKGKCAVTVVNRTEVDADEWQQAFGSATNYVYSKKDRNDTVTEQVKFVYAVEGENPILTTSYKKADGSEVIFVSTIPAENEMILPTVVKYYQEGGVWKKHTLTAIEIVSESDVDFVAVTGFETIMLSGFAEEYAKFTHGKDIYDETRYVYSLTDSETNPVKILLDYGDDGETPNYATISNTEFSFVNGKIDNGYFLYDDVKYYVEAVGTTTITVPDAEEEPEEPATPTGSQVTADQWATILGVPAENVSVVAGMMVESGGTSMFMPAMTFAMDATWTKTTVVGDGGISYKFFNTESDGKSYSYTSTDGLTIDPDSKTLVENLFEDSDYMTAYGTCVGNVMFAGSFADFTFDEASGAYIATSLTIMVSDESTLAEPGITGEEEEPTESTTMTFTNVKIVFVDGALYSLEYTANQGTGDVIFKFSGYGTTIAAPSNAPATPAA